MVWGASRDVGTDQHLHHVLIKGYHQRMYPEVHMHVEKMVQRSSRDEGHPLQGLCEYGSLLALLLMGSWLYTA